jgi:hypothetical protein
MNLEEEEVGGEGSSIEKELAGIVVLYCASCNAPCEATQ